jgi:hypothetical protein
VRPVGQGIRAFSLKVYGRKTGLTWTFYQRTATPEPCKTLHSISENALASFDSMQDLDIAFTTPNAAACSSFCFVAETKARKGRTSH